MSETTRKFLAENCPELLAKETVRDLLLGLDEFVTINCYDENDDITELGREAFAAYDDIFYSARGMS